MEIPNQNGHGAAAAADAVEGAETRPARVSVLIVDDHPIVRESMSLFLRAEPDLDILGACETADACKELCEQRQIRPDVILTDIEMPGSSAFKLARDLSRGGSAPRFVFLSAYLTDTYLDEVLRLPTAGYLLKSATVQEIAAAVKSVAAGKPYFCADVTARVTALAARRSGSGSRLRLLTAREREVLRAVASDMSGKEIAKTLGLSARTVDRHKANIMAKLGIHSQVGLTRFALAEGLCDPRVKS